MVVKRVIETDLVLKTRFFSENIFCLPARIQTFLTWEKYWYPRNKSCVWQQRKALWKERTNWRISFNEPWLFCEINSNIPMSSTNHTLAAQQKKVRFQCYEKWHAWSVYLYLIISTLGALRRPMMPYDDHPIQLHHVPLFALNEPNKPQVAPRRLPMK